MAKTKYCCERFSEALKNNEVVHGSKNDETEWFIDGLWHIYYCPFCGASIKGRGWGDYTRSNKKSKKNKNQPKKTTDIVRKHNANKRVDRIADKSGSR